MILCDFHSIRPASETSQAETLEWIVNAHCQAEKTLGMNEDDISLFRSKIHEKLWHVGCKPDRIEKRGHVLEDFLHLDWDRMQIYKLNQCSKGVDLSVRSRCFEEYVDLVFEKYYPEDSPPPEELIHVTCTGYVAPSGAQKIVSKRNWGTQTTVTHAYHMGCYASLPAIRIGAGFLHSGKKTVDIVHTELCSLHSNPSLHETDQLVSQSLFADGFMKYKLRSSAQNPTQPALNVLAALEEILPNSINSMSWTVSDWGFQMTLAREIPVLITRSLKNYLEKLCALAKVPYETILKTALFAVHPGGPKILVHIQDLLSLRSEQMGYSFEILKNYGNMSSATLPHIWQKIVESPEVKQETLIVSLAFGPGLTISGAIMEKTCGF